MQPNREKLVVTVSQSVYQYEYHYEYEDDGTFDFYLDDLDPPQYASLTLVPDEASEGVTFMVYDESGNPVDENNLFLEFKQSNYFRVIIYRDDDAWNIIHIYISL